MFRLTRPSAIGQSLIRYLSAALKEGSKEQLESLVKGNPIVVFMKGTPEAPRCGFSNAVVQVLRMHGVKKYTAVNVLENENIRQGIKEYSNWPTIPQIFIKGEFIGGCDILLEMHQKGEFPAELQKVGIKSEFVAKEQETK